MKKYITILLIASIAKTSCKSGPSEEELAAETKRKNDSILQQAARTRKAGLNNLAFASTKDPICGMPTKGGVEDTATVKGKLYGFCAKECKEQFLKEQ